MLIKAELGKIKKRYKEWQARRKELYGEGESAGSTDSGIEVKSVYTPLDIVGVSQEDLGLPGEYPYTRGGSHLPYRYQPWATYQEAGFESPEETRKRRELIGSKGEGGESAWIPLDLPTDLGYDSDHPVSKGRVGECGVAISTVDDIGKLLSAEDLQRKTNIILTHNTLPVMVAMVVVMAERNGVPASRVNMVIPGFRMWLTGHSRFPFACILKNEAECVKYAVENLPKADPVNVISGYNARDSGLDSQMEIAFCLAEYIALVEEVMKSGLPPERFVDRIQANLMAKLDIFETVAKFRALRRMHARITRERFHYDNAPCLKTWANTSGAELAAQQPVNNIARLAIQGVGSVLAGAPCIHLPCYDEPLWIPSQHAAIVSLRIHQILFYEPFITSVSDPLGGSYYVEWLTDELERRAGDLLKEIEDRGGFIKCLEHGYFQSYAANNAYKEFQEWNSAKRVRVGFNKYIEADEKITIPDFKIDAGFEPRRVKELAGFKQGRDNARVQEALEQLRMKLRDNTELVPALIETTRADATMGEMMEVMRQEWGWVKNA